MRARGNKLYTVLPMFLGILLLLSGCGSTSDDTSETKPKTTTGSTGSGGSVPTPIPTPTPSYSPDPELAEALAFPFSITGNTGSYTSPEIPTDTKLRVRIRATDAGPLTYPGYESFSMPYGCVKYTITVGSYQVSKTLSLGNGLDSLCPDAPRSAIIDFTPWVRNRGPSAPPLTVTVSNPYYDWRCRYVWTNYCPISPVYSTHNVQGTVEVETDETQFGPEPTN